MVAPLRWLTLGVAAIAAAVAASVGAGDSTTETRAPHAGTVTADLGSGMPPLAVLAAALRSAGHAGLPAACRRAERAAARNNGLWRVGPEVESAVSGDAPRAIGILNRVTDRITARLKKKCGGIVPGPYDVFVAQAARATDAGQYGLAQHARVLRAWLRWGLKIGASGSARHELRSLRWCRAKIWPRVESWYELTSTPSVSASPVTGLEWRLTLSFDNRTGRALPGSTFGWLEVRGWREPSRGVAGPGQTARLDWDGSSADVLEVRRGASSRRIGPFESIATTSDGTVEVRDIKAVLTGRYGCGIPVPSHTGPSLALPRPRR